MGKMERKKERERTYERTTTRNMIIKSLLLQMSNSDLPYTFYLLK
jgi:hypothetical protein